MKKTTTILFITTLLLSTTAYADITDGLVGQWKFDRSAQTMTSALQVADNPSLDGMLVFTIAAWVKLNQGGAGFTIASKRHSSAPWYSYNFSVGSDNKVTIGIVNSSGKGGSAGSATALTIGEWQQVAAVYDGTKVVIYVNGKKDGWSNNLTGAVFDSNGSLYLNYQAKLNGLLDDVRIYNQALSEGDISTLYSAGATSLPIPAPEPTPASNDTPTPTSVPTGIVVTAASCAQVDVQSAVDAAKDGDTVLVPEGQCTWVAPVTFCKNVVLKARTQGGTDIVDGTTTAWNQSPFWIDSTCSDKTFRISGFNFSDLGVSDSLGIITIKGNRLRYRLDHLNFNDIHARAVWVDGNQSYGIIDHINVKFNSHNQAVFVAESDYNNAWQRPMSYGTDQAVYIEDSNFDYTNVPVESGLTDCERGGRYVFRHNTVTGDASITNHGLDSVMRSCLQMEIYDNRLTSDRPGSYRAIYSRGGSAIIFNNTISGRYSSPLGMTSYRSCGYAGAPVQAGTGPTAPNFGTCDGTNPLDGNTSPQSTYKGWPCKDQVGRGSNQSSEPVYEWNNTMNGVNSNILVNNTWLPQCTDPQPSDHIKEGRDYFTDTARPGYTPYTYPHPMTTSGFTGDNPLISQIIPEERRVDWTKAGVPGGIPTNWPIFAQVTDAPCNAKGDGVTDDTAAIQACINAAPNKSVVFFPPGNYHTTASLNLIGKGLIFRGAGPSKTKIINSNGTNIFSIGTSSFYSLSVALTAGHTKGSTTVTASSAAGFSVGDMVLIDQLNDETGSYTGYPVTIAGSSATATWVSRDLGTRAQGQYAMVTEVSGNNISFTPPLNANYYSALSPQISKQKYPTSYVGFEDLYMEDLGTELTKTRHDIELNNVAYFWITGCEFNKSMNGFLYLNRSVFGDIHRNWLHDGIMHIQNRSYGVELGTATAAVIAYDNIVGPLVRSPFHMEWGANGNVFAYNYVVPEKINDASPKTTVLDFSGNHGAHPMMNLVEGNIGCGFRSDFLFGSSSHYTIFRNYFYGVIPGYTEGTTTIDIERNQTFYNVVGNVLGKTGESWGYSLEYPAAGSFTTERIRTLGYSSSGLATSGGSSDTADTLIWHGNYDFAHNATVWDDAILEHNLPASMLYTQAPDWWGNLPWPPIGPDVPGMVNKIPAQIRYEQMINPKGSGDVSGDNKVTMYDAALALRYSITAGGLTQAQIVSANMDGNKDPSGREIIDNADIIAISRKALGL